MWAGLYSCVTDLAIPSFQQVAFSGEAGKRARRPSVKLMSSQIDTTPHGNATVHPPHTGDLGPPDSDSDTAGDALALPAFAAPAAPPLAGGVAVPLDCAVSGEPRRSSAWLPPFI